ncbi:MAG: glycosyltransferase family 4 protein [Bacteroidia bacterium]
MRVLQLCHKPPFPPVDGGCVAMAAVTNGLIQQGIDLWIYNIATHKHPFNKDYFPKEIENKNFSFFIDTKINALKALKALIKNNSYNISRFYNQILSNQIIQFIQKEKIDLVHIESLYGMPYAIDIKKNTKAKIILRSHNIEHHLWEQKAQKESNIIKKIYLQILAKQLKQFELKSFSMADGIISISSSDSNFIQQSGIKTKLITVPVGITEKEFQENTSNSIYHIGAMDWQPNVEGLNWFLENVWSLVLDKKTGAELHLAGRNMPKEKYSNYKNVIVYGEVENSEKFAADKGIMIIPVHRASGIRIKLAEAMMMGKAIVSTSIGASGIENLSNKEILIADNAFDFAEKILLLLENENLKNEISKNAHHFALQHFEQDKCSQKIIDFYNKILNN